MLTSFVVWLILISWFIHLNRPIVGLRTTHLVNESNPNSRFIKIYSQIRSKYSLRNEHSQQLCRNFWASQLLHHWVIFQATIQLATSYLHSKNLNTVEPHDVITLGQIKTDNINRMISKSDCFYIVMYSKWTYAI